MTAETETVVVNEATQAQEAKPVVEKKIIGMQKMLTLKKKKKKIFFFFFFVSVPKNKKIKIPCAILQLNFFSS
jgi:hypothetical protein